MKKILIVMIIFLALPSVAAQEINSYKYVIIPDEYEFLREPNQYQLNELTKFLFTKAGFDPYLQGEELPEDLESNPCTALSADVEKEQGLFVTKLYVTLKNCKDQVVYTSEIGSSREKDYKTTYHAALRDAFKSIEALNYSYTPGSGALAEKSTGYNSKEKVVGEVKSSTPEEEIINRAPETDPEEVNSRVGDQKMLFDFDNAVYYLEKNKGGFKLYQQGISEPVASLFASGSKDVFLYSSSQKCGVAYFEKDGDLVVEIIQEGKASPAVWEYKKVDQ